MKSSSPKKILITGGAGQLAFAIQHHSQAKNYKLFSYDHQELDITDIANIHNAINKCEPDFVINTAAYTAVDKAEQDTLNCVRTNHLGAMNLSIVCRKEKIPLLHLSTDYVFDGNKDQPYVEDDEPSPINYYGKSKWLGEQAIKENCHRYVILRVSGVFSASGNNFYKTIIRLAKERKILRVVCDQITCPTSADDIASAIYKMINKNLRKTGIYHYCSDTPISWYEFASHIVTHAKAHMALEVEDLQAITSAEYQTVAARPVYSVLDCKKIKKDYGIEQKSWEQAIKLFIKTGT